MDQFIPNATFGYISTNSHRLLKLIVIRLGAITVRRVALATFISIALCASASEEDRDYRHETMEAVGAHMKSIAAILQEKVAHTRHLQVHADALAGLAKITPDIFPDGSQGGEALDLIWEEPDDFAETLNAFEESTAKFQEAVTSSDMDTIRTAVKVVGQSCKGCHDKYRED